MSQIEREANLDSDGFLVIAGDEIEWPKGTKFKVIADIPDQTKNGWTPEMVACELFHKYFSTETLPDEYKMLYGIEVANEVAKLERKECAMVCKTADPGDGH